VTSPTVADDGTADHRAWVEQIMGMPMSIHVRGPGARSTGTDAVVAQVFDELRAADAMFSRWKPSSQLSRLQRGELTPAEADPLVREVLRLCGAARIRTDGWFDAWNAVPGRPGVFDPTGLVKTWAVARAARPLRELAARAGIGYAVGAGGDVLTRPGADGAPWMVGIEDPRERSRVLATLPAGDGGVATSGIAIRGAHILDPRTGEPAVGVLSATVAGPSLMWADVFATAAVAMGSVAVEWVAGLHGTSGLIVLADDTVHRWSNPV